MPSDSGSAENVVKPVSFTRLPAGKIKEFVGRPNRTGARGEIEFDPVFVGVKPGVEQEGFQSHQATSGQIDVAGEDPANLACHSILTLSLRPGTRRHDARRVVTRKAELSPSCKTLVQSLHAGRRHLRELTLRAVLELLVPGHLDGFELALVGSLGIAGKAGEFGHVTMQIGEADSEWIEFRMGF